MNKHTGDSIVRVFMFPREYTKGVVNLSPFAIKLETWLRLHNIQYEVVETIQMSKSTGQIPYIVHNGQEIADSNEIITYLTNHYGIETDDNLSPEELAISRAFLKMIEEHTSWTYFLPRYCYNPERFSEVFRLSLPWPLRKLLTKQLSSSVLQRAKYHGIGRKDKGTVAKLGNDDLRAISNFLAQKDFMFGDRITTLDCCIYGHLSQIVYVNFPFPHKEVLANECQNVVNYLNRIKNTLWPDWEEMLAKTQYKF